MIKTLLIGIVVLFSFSNIFAQSKNITGKVTENETSAVLPGVTVNVKGTTIGVVTDFAGRYSINVPSGTSVLVFSQIGMQPAEVSVGNQQTINIQLKPNTRQLKEVIVNAIGVETQRDKFASSVSTVKGKNIAQSGETNLLTGMSSKLSGVLITRNGGDPGSGGYIQVRGQNTINGNAQPLFIIDGMPVSNSNDNLGAAAANGIVQQSRINDINPEDIESMEVLKGASAAALWGTRAANGVIIIKTKRGKNTNGKLNITYKSTISFDRVNKLPPLQSTYGQGSGGFYNQGNKVSFGDYIPSRSGGADTYITSPGAAGYQGYVTFPDGSQRYAIQSGNAANPHGGKNSTETYNRYNDIFQTGHFWENNLTLSGGDSKSTFLMSYGNLNQDGIAKAFSKYGRNTARVNAATQFNSWLRGSANIGYSKINSQRNQEGDNVDGLMLGATRTPADFDNRYYTGTYTSVTGEMFQNAHVSYRNPLGKDLGTIYANPVWNLYNNRNSSDVDRITGTLELSVTPTNWLNITGRTGIDNFTDDRTERFARNSATFLNGYLSKNLLMEKQFNSDIFASANKTWSDNFKGTLLAGFNYNNRRRSTRSDAISNLIVPTAPDILTNALNSNLVAGNTTSLIRTYAYYLQTDVEALDMFYLTLTGRNESASTFGNKTSSSFFFPSAALAWQLTKLKAFNQISFLEFAKLRATWGQVGIQPQPYQNFTVFSPAVYGDTFTRGLSAASALYGGGYSRSFVQGNDYLKPERKTETELGLDLRMFKSRVNFSATVYTNKTKDVILSLNVPNETGFTVRNTNAAVLSNKGIELDAGADVISQNAFRWNVSANFSANRSKVNTLAGATVYTLPDAFLGLASLIPGQPFGVFYSTDFLKDAAGKYVLDSNGFPQPGISNEIVGNPNPKWQGGLGTTLSYKKVSLYVLFSRVAGNSIFNGTRGSLYSIGTHGDQGNTAVAPAGGVRDVTGALIPAGTSFQGYVTDFGGGPVAINQAWWQGRGSASNTASYKQFVEDGSATRLREVTLTYTLNSPAFQRFTHLEAVDFSITGRNLVLWTKYSGVDPETNVTGAGLSRGQDWFNNPNTRSFLFSLQIRY
ncbi:SusC/RagA family TonB-linked outer membrane protein [Mucilaginibacter pallidiroseus]|uniref:SusC/RagA family TonB-linked outer membrane protein n=1 Tax=Mucilaginibacter pallidiroseus TaxID=2599295 RepID=A0A563U3J5_9SPHI|nr:SusC/RagA family TonB-linked outer membrane protein [Mucilaginibacter pallidiroseus]TWR25892.1 SusC/RagA family TonB-linked outer membrane protein [Mucilaginibacter pallidiroseus]